MIWRTSGIVALQQESVFQLGGITSFATLSPLAGFRLCFTCHPDNQYSTQTFNKYERGVGGNLDRLSASSRNLPACRHNAVDDPTS